MPEVEDQIFDCLSNGDLISARQVCRKWSSSVTRYIRRNRDDLLDRAGLEPITQFATMTLPLLVRDLTVNGAGEVYVLGSLAVLDIDAARLQITRRLQFGRRKVEEARLWDSESKRQELRILADNEWAPASGDNGEFEVRVGLSPKRTSLSYYRSSLGGGDLLVYVGASVKEEAQEGETDRLCRKLDLPLPIFTLTNIATEADGSAHFCHPWDDPRWHIDNFCRKVGRPRVDIAKLRRRRREGDAMLFLFSAASVFGGSDMSVVYAMRVHKNAMQCRCASKVEMCRLMVIPMSQVKLGVAGTRVFCYNNGSLLSGELGERVIVFDLWNPASVDTGAASVKVCKTMSSQRPKIFRWFKDGCEYWYRGCQSENGSWYSRGNQQSPNLAVRAPWCQIRGLAQPQLLRRRRPETRRRTRRGREMELESQSCSTSFP